MACRLRVTESHTVGELCFNNALVGNPKDTDVVGLNSPDGSRGEGVVDGRGHVEVPLEGAHHLTSAKSTGDASDGIEGNDLIFENVEATLVLELVVGIRDGRIKDVRDGGSCAVALLVAVDDDADPVGRITGGDRGRKHKLATNLDVAKGTLPPDTLIGFSTFDNVVQGRKKNLPSRKNGSLSTFIVLELEFANNGTGDFVEPAVEASTSERASEAVDNSGTDSLPSGVGTTLATCVGTTHR